MKKYIVDFVRSMWLMAASGIASAYGVFYATQHHHYFAMGIFGIILSVVMCAWAPYLEEKFKMDHSNTKMQALVFGVFEMILYSWQVVGGISTFLVCRVPMLLMHLASAECYYHSPSKRMFYFWLANHMAWNILACVKPTLLLKGSVTGSVRPTMLTICLMLFWGTSLMFKLVRKKDVVVVK